MKLPNIWVVQHLKLNNLYIRFYYYMFYIMNHNYHNIIYQYLHLKQDNSQIYIHMRVLFLFRYQINIWYSYQLKMHIFHINRHILNTFSNQYFHNIRLNINILVNFFQVHFHQHMYDKLQLINMIHMDMYMVYRLNLINLRKIQFYIYNHYPYLYFLLNKLSNFLNQFRKCHSYNHKFRIMDFLCYRIHLYSYRIPHVQQFQNSQYIFQLFLRKQNI